MGPLTTNRQSHKGNEHSAISLKLTDLVLLLVHTEGSFLYYSVITKTLPFGSRLVPVCIHVWLQLFQRGSYSTTEGAPRPGGANS